MRQRVIDLEASPLPMSGTWQDDSVPMRQLPTLNRRTFVFADSPCQPSPAPRASGLDGHVIVTGGARGSARVTVDEIVVDDGGRMTLNCLL